MDVPSGQAMGSPLVLQVPRTVEPAELDEAWRVVVEEFEATEQALSRFRPTSEVHQVRLGGGRSDHPSRRLVAALAAAERARRVTDGRFDPRVLADLERLGSRPIAGVPVATSSHSGRVFRRDGRTGTVDVPVPVDFGGIGKGLALRWAARRVAAVLGARGFLLDAGRDLVSSGTPTAKERWRVGIEEPADAGRDGASGATATTEPVAVVELPAAGAAIATSSTKRARWTSPDGRRVHHLIDPRTGEPGGDGLLAVTVLASDPAWAEVWSKTLFLAGRDGIAFLARRRGLAAWWVTTDDEIEMTPAARPSTIWVRGER